MKSLSWRVEGRTADYTVTLSNGVWTCECPSQQHRGTMCRHTRAVAMLQKLALLDREAVDTLERLAKEAAEKGIFGRIGMADVRNTERPGLASPSPGAQDLNQKLQESRRAILPLSRETSAPTPAQPSEGATSINTAIVDPTPAPGEEQAAGWGQEKLIEAIEWMEKNLEIKPRAKADLHAQYGVTPKLEVAGIDALRKLYLCLDAQISKVML